jgi:2-pyrone-4,6-dicarboxylate lactonase
MTSVSHEPDSGTAPAYVAPKGACDAHFHVFGPEARYPYEQGELRYRPPYAPIEHYLQLAHRLGFERFVLVQPSAYGMNNSCMLDAMRELDPAVRRGIIHLDEVRVTDRDLTVWDELGVRGIRVNVPPTKAAEAGFADVLRPRMLAYADIARELGWHVELLTPGWLIRDLMPTLREFPVAFSVAHFGLFPVENGLGQPGFRDFLDLLRDGSKRCWIKLSGIYRVSADPDFADATDMAQALIDAAPDRAIWGTDFPHLSFSVDTVKLYNKLGEWADAAMRQRILVDNPARLYGFW